ncbi:hypothetical protein RB653_002780 [Dictyostelium firmibasis]|uniref:Protein HIRA n=1 Tax=Dictyostelium firmibasis TaxID=79012 RepID=A0AAN7TPF8_9MYCE
MKILKPQWVTHGGLSIYSVDIHPDGTRMATGGGDAKIKIWSMAPISLLEVEEDAGTPKLLCSIENAHFHSVNSVKWSKDGKYLASGSDDKLCMIWGLSNNNSLIKNTTENWVCVATLRGHASDISEVSWSPDNKYIATSSFDKTIIIWETNKFQMVSKLEEHKGFVKGLAWDPLGRYLASQSEDKSLIIWRTSDWVVETIVTEPFKHSGNSFFLRPSWTPDGQFIVATHGINNATHTGVLVSRTDWDIGLDLVGHRKAVVVSRCSPKIYKDFKSRDQKFCLILLGGQDSTLSLWSSSSPRSLMVTRSLFDQCIQDISWCSDGYSFVACSTDGTVGYISLDPEEVGGSLIGPEEKQIFFKNYYGDAVTVDKEGNLIYGTNGNLSSAANGGSHAILPENPDQLAMEESNANGVGSVGGTINQSGVGGENDPKNPNSTSTLQPTQLAMQNQKQTIMPGGKRRITPIFIGSSSQNITKPQPVAIPLHLQQLQHSSSSPLKPMEIESSSTTVTLASTTTGATSTTITPTKMTPMVPFGLNKLNGRLDSAVDGSNDRFSHPRIRDHQHKDSNNHHHKSSHHDKSDKDKSDRDDQSSSSRHNKRRTVEPEPTISITSSKKKKSSGGSSNKQQNDQIQQNTAQYINNNSNNVIISTVSAPGFSIPLPTLTNKISKKLIDQPIQTAALNNRLFPTMTPNTTTTPGIGGSIIIDVNITEQELQDNTVEYFSVIRYLSFETQLWENRIAGRITLITGNKNWCAATTLDSLLYIFNKNGTIIMSNIVPRNQLSFLESNRTNHLLAITCDGFVCVWNVLKKKVELSNRELPFLKNRDNLTIKHAMVTEESGKPIITFSNGDSFVYSSDVGEWVKITDRLGVLSEYNSNDTTNTGILSTLQNNNRINSIINSNTSNINNQQQQQQQQPSVSNLLSLSNSESQQQQQLSTSLFLEKQLWLAQVLESSLEYKHWLLIYTKYLTNCCNIVKLTDLCTDLLGPSSTLNLNGNNHHHNHTTGMSMENTNPFSNSLSTPWESTILGLSKRSLLKEILPIMAGNRTLQRMVGQFKESLNAFSKNVLIDPFDTLLNK